MSFKIRNIYVILLTSMCVLENLNVA